MAGLYGGIAGFGGGDGGRTTGCDGYFAAIGGDAGHAGVGRQVSDAAGAGTTCRGDSKGGISGDFGDTGGGKSEYFLIYQGAIPIKAFSAVSYIPIIVLTNIFLALTLQ